MRQQEHLKLETSILQCSLTYFWLYMLRLNEFKQITSVGISSNVIFQPPDNSGKCQRTKPVGRFSLTLYVQTVIQTFPVPVKQTVSEMAL